MNWLLVMLLVAGGLALGRIFLNLKKLRDQNEDDWDAKLIARLRSAGSDPFRPHDVDFFLAMPSNEVAEKVKAQLVADGFVVDLRNVPENPTHPVSLHVLKSMQLSVDDMRAIGRKFKDIALANDGQYDGWSAGHVPRQDTGGIDFRRPR